MKTEFAALFSRRLALGAAGAAFAVLAAFGLQAPARAQGATVSAESLMAPGALPDVWEGSKDAPITIVEYASMTCSHCAAFHQSTYPVLKSKYIDTGKVRFTLREFPLDPLAAAAFMLARCAGDDKRDAVIDLLFAQQKNWAFVDQPATKLEAVLKQTGMGREAFEACLNNQKLLDDVQKVRDQASKEFGVSATPTFFINGKKQSGEVSPETLDKLLEPLLKG
ncbi:DsbA family protein [Methylocella sp.]|uniref:DsbA family protein n=1 Tax=Methylocella sp. TaxID=1978226 RepID=UPI003784BF96